MFRWLGSILGLKRPRQNPSSRDFVGVQETDRLTERKLVLDDAEHIEAALINLAKVGLELTPVAKNSLQETAEEIAEQWEGISFSKEPTPGDWALVALSAEVGAFENAIFIDAEYAELQEYPPMISSIIALAGDEWPIEGVETKSARRPDAVIGLLEWDEPITVTITAKPEVAPFEIMHVKYFDWSLISRLNERLPKHAAGRFAIFQDGNTTIVFLTPEKIQQLNLLCGCEFLILL